MPPITPMPAATVTLARDGPQGVEVLMMRRNLQSAFVPGKYVFPGGSVDRQDAAPEMYGRCAGLKDAAASQRLGVAGDGLAFWVAAIRESFEEAGLLLAYDAAGNAVTADGAGRLSQRRPAVASGELPFAALLRDEDLTLATDGLVYFSHWITPAGAPRRYDTRFFVARAPDGQEAVSDNDETISSLWVRPCDGVERFAAGEFKMLTPTIHTLRLFAQFDTADALIAAMRALPDVPTIEPRVGKDGRRVMPGEPGYDDVKTYDWKPL